MLGVVFVLMSALASYAKPVQIVTTFYPIYIMTKNIVKNIPEIDLVLLAPASAGCVHDFSLSPLDMKRLSNADILIANGAGMELFLPLIRKRYPELPIVEAAVGLPLITLNWKPNPHVWVSVGLAMQEVKTIATELAKVDPAHQNGYRTNALNYLRKLELLRLVMKKELAPFRDQPLVSFHDVFAYFGRDYGFTVATMMNHDPDDGLSAKEITRIIRYIKKNNVKRLFIEPQYASSAAQLIERETQAKTFYLDPAVSGPNTEDAYLTIMRSNLKTLKLAFSL